MCSFRWSLLVRLRTESSVSIFNFHFSIFIFHFSIFIFQISYFETSGGKISHNQPPDIKQPEPSQNNQLPTRTTPRKNTMVWSFANSEMRKRCGRYSTASTHTRRISHTNMLGGCNGKLFVNDTEVNEFQNAYAIDIQRGMCALPLTEIHSRVFPFYMDVDLELPTYTIHSGFEVAFVTCLQNTLSKFYASVLDTGGGGEHNDSGSIDPFCIVVCTKTKGASARKTGKLVWYETQLPLPYDYNIMDIPERLHDDLLERINEQPNIDQNQQSVIRIPQGVLQESVPDERQFCVRSNDVIIVNNRVFYPAPSWKHGFHIHIYNLFVTIHEVTLIRENTIQACLHASQPWGAMLGKSTITEQEWRGIIDEKVYCHSERGGGLRLIGAPKSTGRCKHLMRRPTFDCEHCMHTFGHILDDSFYWPRTVYRGQSVSGIPCVDTQRSQRARTHFKWALEITSVRCRIDATVTTGFKTFPGHMRLQNNSIWSSISNQSSSPLSKVPRRVVLDSSEREYCQARTWQASSFRESTSDAQLTVVKNIATRINHAYKDCYFVVKNSEKATACFVSFRGPGSTYCMNKKDHHNSSSVYMVINQAHAQMRCRCTKPTLRSCGTCARYKSPIIALTQDERAVMNF